MTAYTWVGEAGDWDLASNWSPSPAGPPTAMDTATISAAGAAYTVTIDSADVAQSLTESSSSATVEDTGSLTLGGTFTLSAGTFILDGGTLSGGTTKLAGGTFVCDGGTLSGVTYDGVLDLSESGACVQLANGTVVNNAAGAGAGMINDTGANSTLDFDNTQTLNNATINLGSTSGYSYLCEYDSTGAGTVLTLGSKVTIDESGKAIVGDSAYAGDGIVNQGNIKQSGTNSYLEFYGNAFINSGAITAASSGGALTIDDITFTNSGTLAVSKGDAVSIESLNFSNTGSITLASGGSLYLDTTFTLAELGTVTNSGGTVYIQGTLNDAGGALNGSGGFGQATLDGGSIQGGTVTSSGLAFSNSGGTLSGVTYDGTLDLSGSHATVDLADGTVVNNAAGAGAGTINDTGSESYLRFDNTQWFNNATINLGAASGCSRLQEYDLTDAGTVLTLGSQVAIDESGSSYITDSDYAGDGIVNNGAINQSGTSSYLEIWGSAFTNNGAITAASSGGTLAIDDNTFTNSGTITVSGGDTVDIAPATFTNLSLSTLTGGAYTVDAGSILELADNAAIVTDDANITLSGAGSTIQSLKRPRAAKRRSTSRFGRSARAASCTFWRAAASPPRQPRLPTTASSSSAAEP
jgi:hypothetical protein